MHSPSGALNATAAAPAAAAVTAPDDDIIPIIWEPGESDFVAGRPHSAKYWSGIILFVIAYIILVPGLSINLYSYSFFGTEITKSTITTITLLWNDGYTLPAVLLAFFALVVPTVKLLLWRLSVYYQNPHLIHVVQYISKWATVDAIVVAFLMGFLSVAVDGLITTQLHAGFPCFVGYCLISTAAAMLVHAVPRDREDTSPIKPEWRRVLTLLINGLALTCWAVASHTSFCALAITLNGKDIDKRDISLWNAMGILYQNHPVALPVLLVFVWALPAFESLLWVIVSLAPSTAVRLCPAITVRSPIGRSCWGLASWLRQLRFWVMWDVATVSILVMNSALNSTDKLRCEVYWAPYCLWWMTMILMYTGRWIGDDFLKLLALEPTIGCADCGAVSPVPVLDGEVSEVSSVTSTSSSPVSTPTLHFSLWTSVTAGVTLAFAAWALAELVATRRGKAPKALMNSIKGATTAAVSPFKISTVTAAGRLSTASVMYTSLAVFRSRGTASSVVSTLYTRSSRPV
ncbi:hypothetical protein FOL47_000007 [Perkinsus chesapeaki]|uniref:Uncharacterized protein n=1 Tax=Perkinsus chesapeaki TaxID=330153 RepID=A0A7J6N4B4_PERCH|nr:hypothetical protein FOL47_000007 [Perkinsus chesapeaki]